MSRMRRVVELFNRCLDVSEEIKEARLVIVDVFGKSSATEIGPA